MERKTEKTEKSVQEETERFKNMFVKANDNLAFGKISLKEEKVFICCLKDLETIVEEIKKIIKENAELRSKCAEYEDMRFHIARLEEDIEQ